MINFERGFDPPFVKLRGKVLAPSFLYFLEVVKVLNEAHLHNEDIGSEDIQIQITSNPSGDYSYIAANFNAGCSIRVVIF